jgi:putative transposase
MIDKTHQKLSLLQQCILIGLARSNLYYEPVPEAEENLEIMQFLDKQYFLTPFYGARKLLVILKNEGYCINKKRLRRLMKIMKWQTIYRAPNTSKPNKENKVYPYLLRNIAINRRHQVWSSDITYIPMKRGFMYLYAIIDVHTRYVLNWSISNTMTAEWCQSIMEDTVKKYGAPTISNTDQGSQFTSNVFTTYLLDNTVQISMDGKGRAIDNIWIERLWRSLKYEDIYLKSYQTVADLNAGLQKYFIFYNQVRIHETLQYKTPQVCFEKAA